VIPTAIDREVENLAQGLSSVKRGENSSAPRTLSLDAGNGAFTEKKQISCLTFIVTYNRLSHCI
jgi:hypothetical protein